MPQITPPSRLEPHHIPAERGVRGIKAQNLLLRATHFEPRGQKDFDRLLPKRTRFSPREPHDLHREGAAAAHHPAVPEVLDRGPSQRTEAESRVAEEGPILEFDQRRDELVRERVARRKPPLTVVGDARSEELAAPIGHHRRVGDPLEELGRQTEKPQAQQQSDAPHRPVLHVSPPHHCTTSTVRFPIIAR